MVVVGGSLEGLQNLDVSLLCVNMSLLCVNASLLRVKRSVCCVFIVQMSLRILTCFLVVCVLCEPQRAAVYQAGAAKKGAPELVGHGQSQSSRHDSGVIYG